MEVSLKQSNSLIIFDKNRWYECLSEIESIPEVVLISAWKQGDVNSQLIEKLIRNLIELGCGYFVCAGKYSESLHDFIDDLIIDMSLDDEGKEVGNIVTTWHDTDTDDEVADFFLHSTNVKNSLLVAILDEKVIEDKKLKKAIVDCLN